MNMWLVGLLSLACFRCGAVPGFISMIVWNKSIYVGNLRISSIHPSPHQNAVCHEYGNTLEEYFFGTARQGSVVSSSVPAQMVIVTDAVSYPLNQNYYHGLLGIPKNCEAYRVRGTSALWAVALSSFSSTISNLSFSVQGSLKYRTTVDAWDYAHDPRDSEPARRARRNEKIHDYKYRIDPPHSTTAS